MRKFTHKLACLMMVMLCCVSLQVKAQSELTVADSTATNSYVPTYGLYADTKDARSQCIYPANLLTDMVSGTISQITFYLSSPADAAWTGTFQVSVGETDQTDLSSGFITDDLTAVYSGSMDATGTTLTVEFADGYTYNGGNLVFDWLVTTAGNWKSASYYGVALTAAGRYRSSASGSGTVQNFLPKATFEYTPGSGGPTCDKPESVEANDVTANSATINWIGSASTYNLQYKASSDADWTLVKNLSGNSYQLSNLVSNTAYQVQVQAICGENTSGWKSVSFSTLIGLPYAEHFNGTSKPSGWNIYSGTLNDDGSAALTESSSYWTFGAKSGVFDTHAHIEVYSTRNYWLVTPSIPIPALEEGDPGYHMLFNLALTYWTGDNVPAPAAQAGAHLYVLASMDEGANWATLREWNNTGSAYVFDEITCSAEGEEVDLDLTSYAGQTIQLAFYLSTSGSGDNRIHIDDLMIDKIPTCLKPTDLHVLEGQATSSTLPVAWTANSEETAWHLQYKQTNAEEWITLDINANPYTITGLSAFTEYEIRVAAVCTAEDYTDYGKSIIAKTAAVVPFAQSFDTTAMPGEWKRYEALLEDVQQSSEPLVSSQNGWNVGTQNGVFSNEHLYLNIAGTDTKYWLVSPVIEMLDGYQLTFDLALTTKAGATPTAVTAGAQNDDLFAVLVSEDGGASWEALGTWGNQGQGSSFDGINTEGQTVKFDLSEYANKSILLAFYGESTLAGGDNNLHISNVAIDLIPACERPLSITVGGITGSSASISWDAEDGQWEYGYVANPAADFAPAESDYTGSTGDKFVDLSDLAETTDYIFFVRRACSETEKSEPLMKGFKTLQTPAALPYDGDFEETNGWLSFHGNFANEWIRGTAVAKTGTHALYISNDNGTTAAYAHSACVVYATKTFYFEEAGMYSFSFDWLCNGESTWDYMRVALVPSSVEVEADKTVPTGMSATSLPDGWTALDGGSKLSGVTEWQTQRTELNVEQMGYYKVVLVWKNDGSGGTAPGGAIDNFKISKLSCRMPGGLTLGEVTVNTASLSWNDDEDGMTWGYACVPAGQEPTEYNLVEQNSLLVEGLEESTAYDFYLRKHCGENEDSEPITISFNTKQLPAEVGDAYVDDFESGNRWLFENGTLENVWVYGEAAHNGEGTHALYISNDGGTTNAYTLSKTTVVFASKIFHFQKGAYTFQYDWRANGEGASTRFDYLRVALVPEDAEFVAGTTLPTGVTYQALPAGCVALDGGIALNLQADWQTFATDAINIEEGNYKVVLLWRNDSGSGSQTPAAVDNFSISRIVCATPANFAAIDTTATTSSIQLTWTPMSEETNWVVRYKEQGAEEWLAVIPAANDTFLLEGLNPSTVYEAQVATQCDPEDPTSLSEFSASISFATECDPFASVDEDFEGTLLCWSAIKDGSGYPAILSSYPEDAHSGSKFLYFASQVGYEPADEYLVLPELISLENMRLKFYACNDVEEATENATLVVGVMPAPADTANFVALDTIVLTTATYNQYVVPFTAYTGDGKYVAIKMLAAETALASARIDDVVVEAIPQCMEPNGLEAVAELLTDNSAVLTWAPQGTEATWLVRYKKSSEESWGEPIVTTNDSLLISGLEMGTSYDAQVAAWCDPENEEAVSPFSGVISFTTLCGTISTLPWNNDFENYAVNSIPTCWDNSASTSSSLASYPYYIFGVYESGNNKMLRAHNYSAQRGTLLINTPAIVLPEGPAYELSFDYSHTATCGDMTIKISVNGGDFVALDPTYAKNSTGTSYSAPDAFEEVIINLGAYAGDTIMIQFYADGNYGSGAIFVDNVSVHKAPSCVKPTGLAISDITVDGAKATWDNAENGAWLYAVALASDEMPAEFTATTDTFAVVSELLDNSDYIFYLRKNCGDEGLSEIISASFHTKMGPAAVPYADDFEAGNNWMFINGGAVNAWAYGEAAHNGEGTHALYISNDNGASNAYSHSACAVYATKAFQFEDGLYKFNYDWKANGESSYDLLCVALVPDSIEIAASSTGQFSLPEGWIKLYEATKLNLSSTWKSESFDLEVAAGIYNVVLLWRNDGSGGSQTPAAVDNFSITKITCKAISELTVSNITASSATINWTAGDEGQDAWQIAYSCDPEFDLAEATLYDAAANTYALAELATDTLYTVYVRANCGDEDGVSLWASTTFRTAKACQTPSDVAAADITTNSASISWNTYGQTGFNLRYSHGTDTVTVENVESPYALNGLAAGTVYNVQVQNVCNTEEWTPAISFKTVYGVPYAENFDALTAYPTEWLRYSGVLIDDVLAGTDSLKTPATSGWTFRSETDKIFNSKHISVNIWSTYKYWTVLPNVVIDENVQLSFTMALSKSTTAYTDIATTGVDDKFAVLISTDDGATWTVLRQWDNAGSEYVYNNIALYGEEVILNLSAYANQKIRIALYGASTTSNADNYLHVDDVLIDHIPACVKPQALTVSDVLAHNATLAWESNAAAWQIALDTISAFNPDTLSALLDVTENPFTLTNLLPSHTYYVYVRANCGDVDGVSVWTAKQSFTTTVACPAPTGLAAQLTAGNGSIATLTWNASEAQEWQVEYSLNSNMSDSLVRIVTAPVANLTGLTAEATYYARVKADCGDLDGESAYSAVISFKPTNLYSIVVNDGTKTNDYVPVYGMYVDNGTTASQFIVPAESLQEIMWDSITTLTFYASQPTSNWGASEFEVYMTTTEDATLSALVDWNSLTQVMVSGNLSIVDNKMVVTLSEPFHYTGDNLLIGFKQTAASGSSSYYSTSSWYGVTANGASIGGYGTGNNMTQRNFLPKMTINYVPGQAPSCMWAMHLEVSDITNAGATFSWDEVEDANWEYALVLASSNEAPTAFVPATNPLVLDNLSEATAYVFYLRNNCGDENSKLVSLAFSTIENIEILPYSTSFADAAGWKFANDANAWIISDGELYISNNGATYAYDDEAASVSFATKLFNFEQGGTYTVSYDWKCVGEYNEEDGAIDYMRAALVPADVVLTPGEQPTGLTAINLPAGWIAIDENAALVSQEDWQRKSVVVPVTGLYRVVFVWINDDSFYDGVPAAIDNLSIVHKDYPTAIEGANAGKDTKAIKFIRDNHVYIMLNGKVYNVTGQAVELK
ncbi:MAG: fibronectin type III domain-containing protein [Paludibacteraceae bacterium]|nr:fibronectin type III domain-containing protein [Paludibacteraceae bacterium]